MDISLLYECIILPGIGAVSHPFIKFQMISRFNVILPYICIAGKSIIVMKYSFIAIMVLIIFQITHAQKVGMPLIDSLTAALPGTGNPFLSRTMGSVSIWDNWGSYSLLSRDCIVMNISRVRASDWQPLNV